MLVDPSLLKKMIHLYLIVIIEKNDSPLSYIHGKNNDFNFFI